MKNSAHPKPRLFEHRTAPLLGRREYLVRLSRFWLFGVIIIFGSLGIGVWGYHQFVGLDFWDALLNASMILFSEGPISPTPTVAGKAWASFYAFFSGVMFITIVGVIFAPVFHRFLHRFHLDIEEEPKNDER